jgi:ABC-type branched-subunit amino acid transport system ATPase component
MTAPPAAPAASLTVEGLSVRFGGLLAVNEVSLAAEAGTITGLIGPNGAGKTTIFNACRGMVTPAAGTVRLDGRPLDRLRPAKRAQRGLGWTFQRMHLWESLSVADNVRLGLECRYAGRWPWSQLLAGRAERAACRAAAEEAMDRCGISHLAGTTVAELSTGHRRLVEFARALAGRFGFLLLDEPAAGLDDSESETFARLLLDTVTRDGTSILLVEHDIALVRQVCQYVYVLDFGRLIHEGPTDETLASAAVKAAYLGEGDLAEAGVGPRDGED